MKNLLLLRKIILIFLFTFLLLNLAKSQVTVNITADKDNTISSTTPDNNAGLSALRAGTTGNDGGNTIHRALLHFNLSSIPPGSKIDSATLTLYVFRVGNQATGVALHKLTANWGKEMLHGYMLFYQILPGQLKEVILNLLLLQVQVMSL